MQMWSLNTYLYGPKDDLKHSSVESFGSLCEAELRGMTFVYALSPGQDIIFSSCCNLTLLKRKQKWRDRVGRFMAACDDVALLHSAVVNSISRALLYDLYPYVWDLRNTLLVAKAFICWLGERDIVDDLILTILSFVMCLGASLALCPEYSLVLENELGVTVGILDVCSFAKRCQATWRPAMKDKYPSRLHETSGHSATKEALLYFHEEQDYPDYLLYHFSSQLRLEGLPELVDCSVSRSLLTALLMSLKAKGSQIKWITNRISDKAGISGDPPWRSMA
ncbi:hypothetical protein cypCar_00001323 [Cyprinus carpio]|nr:hypothetical protein cypCar_00001323 [Cyprinus carpio]